MDKIKDEVRKVHTCDRTGRKCEPASYLQNNLNELLGLSAGVGCIVIASALHRIACSSSLSVAIRTIKFFSI